MQNDKGRYYFNEPNYRKMDSAEIQRTSIEGTMEGKT